MVKFSKHAKSQFPLWLETIIELEIGTFGINLLSNVVLSELC